MTPENLANLQAVAEGYVASESELLNKICENLKDGRGSDMPGIGRPKS